MAERPTGALRAAAASARLGMAGQAGAALARAIDALLAEPAWLPSGAGPLFEALVRAQARGDAIGLADRLEHELLPLLEREG